MCYVTLQKIQQRLTKRRNSETRNFHPRSDENFNPKEVDTRLYNYTVDDKR